MKSSDVITLQKVTADACVCLIIHFSSFFAPFPYLSYYHIDLPNPPCMHRYLCPYCDSIPVPVFFDHCIRMFVYTARCNLVACFLYPKSILRDRLSTLYSIGT